MMTIKQTIKARADLAKHLQGNKLRSTVLQGLADAGLVQLVREQRMSGAGGMPSTWMVIVGATLTDKGRALLAAPAPVDGVSRVRWTTDTRGNAQRHEKILRTSEVEAFQKRIEDKGAYQVEVSFELPR